VGLALGALALAFAGCGAEERINEPRPPAPTRVSVSISEQSITVQPPRIAIGPEPTQRLPQNQRAGQPQIRGKAPLTVVLVAANLTDFDSRLELKGPKDVTSGALVANGNGTLQVDLPTGVYEVTAADIPGARAAKLVVGPYRVSSENELLLP
jgi:hypothetical protein